MSNQYFRINYSSSSAGDVEAEDVGYDNSTSGLTAENVQAAIDEVDANLDTETAQRVAADSAEQAARIAADALLIPLTQKGQPNGVATLDGSGKVPSAQLPSYVDDVLEFANLAAFPVTGETGKIYIALDTNKEYRWSGSQYIELSKSPVDSVFGRTGIVVAAPGDYTAAQVTNVPSGNLSATTVQAALNELQTDVDTRATSAALAQETADRIAADSVLQGEIDAEETRALAAEADLLSDIDQEIIDRTAADADLQDQIDLKADQTALDAEIARATAAEALVQTNLDNHINDTTDAHDATAISYSNVVSGLTATNVQTAVDEVNAKIDNFNPGSPGDIPEASFSLANNQASPANVTGFAFANGVVRSFSAIVSVYIDATSDIFESFELEGIQKAGSWTITEQSEGDDSGVTFDITAAGQIQYVSANSAGFVSGTIKFRAITTSV